MSNCSYGPNGSIPRDASFTSGLRSKNIIGCSAKFATIEANDMTLNNDLRVDEVIDSQNVKYYGAVGDGVADDTAAFIAAFAAAKTLYIPSGTYNVGATVPLQTGGSYVFDNNAHVVFTSTTVNDILFDIAGSQDAGAQVISNAIAVGATVITGIADTAGFAVNDVVEIARGAQTVFPGMDYLDKSRGQLAKIKSVDSATQVTLYDATVVPFDANATMQRYNMVTGIRFQGGRFTADNALLQRAIVMQFAEQCSIEGGVFEGFTLYGITLAYSYDTVVRNCWITDTSAASGAYGVLMSNSSYIVVEGCNMTNMWHGISSGGSEVVCVECRYLNNSVISTASQAALDAHEPALGFLISGNLCVGSGIDYRGVTGTISNNVVNGGSLSPLANYGIYVGASNSLIATSPTSNYDIAVTGNRLVSCAVGIYVFGQPDAGSGVRQIVNVMVSNNDLTNCATGLIAEIARNVTFHNNSLVYWGNTADFTNTAIIVGADCSNITVSNNVVDGADEGIFSTTTLDKFTVVGNQVRNTVRRGVEVRNCAHVVVQNNHVSNVGVGAVTLQDGIYCLGNGKVFVSGNTVYVDNASNNRHGILVWNSTDAVITHNYIKGNPAVATQDSISAATNTNLTITDNFLVDGRRHYVVSTATSLILANNQSVNPSVLHYVLTGVTTIRRSNNSPFPVTFTAGDTTPAVEQGEVFLTANVAPTTITNFDEGINGQEILVIVNDANTTVDMSANANIIGNGGVDVGPGAAGATIRAVYYNGVWRASVTSAT